MTRSARRDAAKNNDNKQPDHWNKSDHSDKVSDTSKSNDVKLLEVKSCDFKRLEGSTGGLLNVVSGKMRDLECSNGTEEPQRPGKVAMETGDSASTSGAVGIHPDPKPGETFSFFFDRMKVPFI